MLHPLLQQLRQQLASYVPQLQLRRKQRKRSAVAMIVQQRDDNVPHILMIKRAESENDPWSGHMAFPGGRLDPGDAHGFAAAVRETEEEIGVTLGSDDPCWGRLSELSAARPGRPDGMFVSPFVFYLPRNVQFTPNYEVADVVWIPLPFLLDNSNRTSLDISRDGHRYSLPCYYWGEYCVWGLSLLMLDEMMALMKCPSGHGGSR